MTANKNNERKRGKMKIGDRVETPDGPGTIVGRDLLGHRAERLVVRLDDDMKYPFYPRYMRSEISMEAFNELPHAHRT